MSKPPIKLKISAGSFGSQSSPVASTPTPGGGPKFRLSMGVSSKPSTPNESVPKPAPKTKSGRAPKPSAKVVANKNGKRTKDDTDDDDAPIADSKKHRADVQRASKKIKLNVVGGGGPKTPTVLKAKFKGKPPVRAPGVGYDSEASDREDDPVIEEEFVLRMIPGDDCEYLRRMIDEKKIGLGRNEGGADIQMKFIHPEGRRAVVTIRKHNYAATLVDLPTVVEGMKSWDKKGWYKSADVCQMLWVFAPVHNEADAAKVDIPKIVDQKTFQYPHGLTPPMHYARKRRFRKRISKTAIEAVEEAVERLLEADARADSTRFELLDPEGPTRNGSRAFSEDSPPPYGNGEEYSQDEDAEGEADDTNNYFSHIPGTEEGQAAMGYEEEIDDDGLAAEMEAALEAGNDMGTPSSQPVAETPDVLLTNGGTPEADGDSGDESSDAADDDDDDGEDDDDEVDEDERARLAQLQGAKEDIAEMERQLGNLESQMSTQGNPILKRRIKDNMEKVKAELQLKKSAIGEADED